MTDLAALAARLRAGTVTPADLDAAADALPVWRPIDENTPTDALHIRGMWIYSAETGLPFYWNSECGSVSDDGDFILTSGDESGWRSEDYTHWTPLPQPPEADNG